LKTYGGFSDMKALFGENVYKVIRNMNANEILEMDEYVKDGTTHHELKEIIEALINLVGN
jgi:hypothetical protein